MAAVDAERHRGIDLVMPALACPVCTGTVHRDDARVLCARGHAFDIARQGYVALLSGRARANTADSVDMVSARERFLAGGHFAPIAAALSSALPRAADGLHLDLAGGTGYYLGAVLDARPSASGVCLDLSTPALRRAARAHQRSAAIAADAWGRLPIRDGAASAVMSVFGPRIGSEIARVLGEDGVLALVTPTRRHLTELIAALGLISVGADKEARLERALSAFDRESTTACHYLLRLDRPAVLDLVLMGPSAHHVDRDELRDRVDRLSDVTTVTVSVEVSIHRPRRKL